MLQAETKEAAVKALLDTAMQMYDLEHFEIMHEELLETRVSCQRLLYCLLQMCNQKCNQNCCTLLTT